MGELLQKSYLFLTDGNFLKAFASKGRFKETLMNMQIKISLNQNTALLGAVHFAIDKVK